MGRKIIDTQDGTLEDDISYGDSRGKMKWSENTIREEVTDRDRCEEGKRDALRVGAGKTCKQIADG